jgi:hypothetical protein
MNEAQTVEVDLNVLAERAPKIPISSSTAATSSSPTRTRASSRRCSAHRKHARLIVADTMNLWIQTQRDELCKLLKKIHGLVLNDGEARLLTEKKNLIEAPATS